MAISAAIGTPRRPLFAAAPRGHTEHVGDHQGFTVVLRGYDIAEVDAMVQRLEEALASPSASLRASVRAELNQPAFRLRLRGYDRVQVDEYLRRFIDRLA